MLLSKQVAVELNLTHCRLKLFMAAMMKANNIDLTPEQFLLIDMLWNQGDLKQQQLADEMQKDKNSVTKLIDALEQKGLVMRHQNPTDRRSNTIVLTEKGHSLKLDAKTVGISSLDKMLEGLSEQEIQSFIVVMRRISKNMSLDNK